LNEKSKNHFGAECESCITLATAEIKHRGSWQFPYFWKYFVLKWN